MKAINLFSLTRMEDETLFSLYEDGLSNRIEHHETKDYEMESLCKLVNFLMEANVGIKDLDDFFFGYKIQHISKEFDLLKVSTNCVLNIELKSKPVDDEKIWKQLVQNRYYLSHITKHILSYTYVSSLNKVFTLNDDETLVETDIDSVVRAIKSFSAEITNDLDNMFEASQFLISPINTPDKFLEGRYFLTDQQEQIQKKIIDTLSNMNAAKYISIQGGAGTGKTLLLYDLAKYCAEKGNTCVIHCGVLAEGHRQISNNVENMYICSIKDIDEYFPFHEYSYVLVDETQRVKATQYDIIMRKTKENNIFCIFSHDPVQVMSKDETARRTSEKIESIPNVVKCKLTGRIRTNKEMSQFITKMFDLSRDNTYPYYNDIDIVYADNEDEAKELLSYYETKGYTFINYTSSRYYDTDFDKFESLYNTHHVIGQEFDNVLMLLDNNFYYDSNRLRALKHPCDNYLYIKLLYQGITRVREKLCIVVIQNKELFKKILNIKVCKIENRK